MTQPTNPTVEQIADYLGEVRARDAAALIAHNRRIEIAEHILDIIDQQGPAPADDITLGLRTLAQLRTFAHDHANDPLNDEPDHWAGTAADHAAQLYNILHTAGLHP